jgi:hypothetical protein
MIDAFTYLSVLISIILGLAVAQVLQGYRALLLARGRIHLDPAPLIWSGLVLMIVAQAWWASFGLNGRRAWDFADFAIILVQMGLIYMLSALVLPDVPAEQPVDLARHFDRHRKAFFTFLIAMLASSIAKEGLLEHRLPSPMNLAFHLILVAIAVAGIIFRGRSIQLAIALIASAGLLAYVTLLFARL